MFVAQVSRSQFRIRNWPRPSTLPGLCDQTQRAMFPARTQAARVESLRLFPTFPFHAANEARPAPAIRPPVEFELPSPANQLSSTPSIVHAANPSEPNQTAPSGLLMQTPRCDSRKTSELRETSMLAGFDATTVCTRTMTRSKHWESIGRLRLQSCQAHRKTASTSMMRRQGARSSSGPVRQRICKNLGPDELVQSAGILFVSLASLGVRKIK